jgi:hypothetical protein
MVGGGVSAADAAPQVGAAGIAVPSAVSALADQVGALGALGAFAAPASMGVPVSAGVGVPGVGCGGVAHDGTPQPQAAAGSVGSSRRSASVSSSLGPMVLPFSESSTA